jgi:signal transduction histidine kinase
MGMGASVVPSTRMTSLADDQEPDWTRWRRPRPTPAVQSADVWLGLGVLVGALAMTVLINSMGAFAFGDAPSLTEQFLWGISVTAPLVLRRRFPMAVLLVVGVLFVGAQVRHVGDNFVPSTALFLAIYSSGAWERSRVVARWSRIAVIVGMFGWLGVAMVKFVIGPTPPFNDAAGPLDPVLASVVYQLGFNLLYFLSAYFFGNMAWLSARRQAELEYQAERLRQSQEQNTMGAIVAERVRIARDLHDVVAHHVSVMGIQAGAARRVLDRDPELARSALFTVEHTARTAIGELRGLLGVLRAEPDGSSQDDKDFPHSSAPGLGQLSELVSATAASAGLHAEFGVYGTSRPVPTAIALSVYRVVQEALTNVVKHAAAHTMDVRLRFLDSAVEVEIADDGLGIVAAPRVGAGFGLVGMRERVAVHGGELTVGPRKDGGYLVRAYFPTTAQQESTKDSEEFLAR